MGNQDITTHKFAAVLNKKADIGKVLNALAHMSLGLAASASAEEQTEMGFIEYIDKDGGVHPHLSKNSYVILRAENANQIRTARSLAMQKKVHFVAFTEQMQNGTYEEQIADIRQTSENEFEYIGLCLFGPIADVSEITRKFQLWH